MAFKFLTGMTFEQWEEEEKNKAEERKRKELYGEELPPIATRRLTDEEAKRQAEIYRT